jgi:NADPH:quinone reductase-like Zn-dependent oxidoreductase
MKAVLIKKHGNTDELQYEDTPIPEIDANEVLIKTYATSVNPIDWKIRNGLIPNLEWKFPMILGWDVSGVIEKTGSLVDNFKPGDEVYAFPTLSPKGTYAEYVAVKADEVAFKPQTITHAESAAFPLAGLTAWQALFDHGKLQAGQRVLINGAAGGVGTLAVQLAKIKGAYVIGTASQKNIAFLKELGADEVIDYTKENLADKLKDIDLVIDCIGGDTQKSAAQVLKPNGILVSIVGVNSEIDFTTKAIHASSFLTKPTGKQLYEIARLIDAGKLKPIVARVMPLEEIKIAHQLSEEGHTRGKIVLEVATQ